ncbi:MAG: chaperone modulator CbpM [Thermodesulfobacteriota bacterium]|nr:chaperone modulator CbpM [Thermodesulfobacteriota bacterium]
MVKGYEFVEVEIVGEKLFGIEEIAQKANMSESSIRRYIRMGLITPIKKEKGSYLLRETTLFRIEKIQRLRRDLGVNLSGIGIILDLLERIEDMDRQLSELMLKL